MRYSGQEEGEFIQSINFALWIHLVVTILLFVFRNVGYLEIYSCTHCGHSTWFVLDFIVFVINNDQSQMFRVLNVTLSLFRHLILFWHPQIWSLFWCNLKNQKRKEKAAMFQDLLRLYQKILFLNFKYVVLCKRLKLRNCFCLHTFIWRRSIERHLKKKQEKRQTHFFLYNKILLLQYECIQLFWKITSTI